VVRAWVDRIAAGDSTAIAQASTVFGAADIDSRTELLNQLASSARESAACLDALLRIVDAHGLDRPAIRRVLVDNDQADDAHQDVMIAIAQGIERFRGDSAFTTWLHSVARYVAIDHLRRRKETQQLGADDRLPTAAAKLSSLIASRSDLAAAVNALPEIYRQPVILRDVDQNTYADIAATLDIELNTVKSRISRGRALVATMLAEGLVETPGPAA
jgi:RNA polymerase sigma-70 factor (ECF subfamily)